MTEKPTSEEPRCDHEAPRPSTSTRDSTAHLTLSTVAKFRWEEVLAKLSMLLKLTKDKINSKTISENW